MPVLLYTWWLGYLVCALLIQKQLPGIDALAPGFLLALQEGKHPQSIWLALLFIVIQEGTGSLGFGMSILWYGGQVGLFLLFSHALVVGNLLFVVLVAASLGVLRAALLWLMCALQGYPLDYVLLINEGIIQALVIPPLWGLAYMLRPKGFLHANRS